MILRLSETWNPAAFVALQKYNPASVRLIELNERTSDSETTMLLFVEIHLKVAAGNDVEEHFTANRHFSTNVTMFDVRLNNGLSISGIKGKIL